jgi:hypothetical protein
MMPTADVQRRDRESDDAIRLSKYTMKLIQVPVIFALFEAGYLDAAREAAKILDLYTSIYRASVNVHDAEWRAQYLDKLRARQTLETETQNETP